MSPPPGQRPFQGVQPPDSVCGAQEDIPARGAEQRFLALNADRGPRLQRPAEFVGDEIPDQVHPDIEQHTAGRMRGGVLAAAAVFLSIVPRAALSMFSSLCPDPEGWWPRSTLRRSAAPILDTDSRVCGVAWRMGRSDPVVNRVHIWVRG